MISLSEPLLAEPRRKHIQVKMNFTVGQTPNDYSLEARPSHWGVHHASPWVKTSGTVENATSQDFNVGFAFFFSTTSSIWN